MTPRKASVEIVDVLLQLGLSGIGDRPDRDRIHHGLDLVARIQVGIELGETRAVDAAGEGIGAGLERPALEAAEAKQRVLRPADRLPELTVADDVDADVGLLAHDLGDGILQALGVAGLVERLAGFLGGEILAQRRRADEAADMGGEDSIGAAFHPCFLPLEHIAVVPRTRSSRTIGQIAIANFVFK